MSATITELHEVLVERNVRIPTSDPTVSLSAVVHRPATADPVHALVTLVPYRNDAGAGLFAEFAHTWLAARGYACVLIDFRGTGSSDGAHRLPFSGDEAHDAVASIDWTAEQAWCTGQIGMWGLSYGAITTMRTASLYPEKLGAIIPMLGMLDPERDFVHPMGARGNAASVAVWGSQALLNQLLPPLDDHKSTDQQARWRARLELDPWILDLFSTSPGDEAWRTRTIDANRITAPALCVSGWRDLFCDPQIRAFEQISGPKRLIAGPWMHNQPWAAPYEAIDFLPLVKRWCDHWLGGVDNGVMSEPPVVAFVQGADHPWRSLPAWPPPPELKTLSAGLDGHESPWRALQVAGPAAPGDQTVGTLSGLWWSAAQGFGLPLDQDTDDRRAISYTTDALSADLAIVGRPRIELNWQSDSAPERLVVKLTDVSPAGSSHLITQGGTTSLVDGHANEIELCATAYRVPAGHRLRIVISDADFPRLWPARDPLRSQPVGLAVDLPVIDLESAPKTPLNRSPLVTSADDAPANSPQWSISRDCITSSIELVHGEEVRSLTPNARHHLVVGHRVTSATSPGGDDASTHVECWATAQLDSGQSLTVEVDTTLSRDSLSALGRVSDDNGVIFERSWEALPDGVKVTNVRSEQ